ncbi:MAG TPA: PPC domain-containing protein, partial [Pirellulaceae bacterium]|nr:PPC domain-containing protein [Pirellulaceae bacterium]
MSAAFVRDSAPRRHSASSQRYSARQLFLEPLEGRCLLTAGMIGGAVFEDIPGDGITPDDLPLADWGVQLYADDGDGVFDAADPLVAEQTTDGGGGYAFGGLPAGKYFVQQQLPLAWIQAEEVEPHEIEVIPPDASLPLVAERNDTISMATATGLSSATPGTYIARGTIGDNKRIDPLLDVDMFQVQLNAGDRLRIDVDTWEFGSELASMLRLFDASGAQLLGHDGGGPAGPFLEFVAKADGLYYAGLASFANGLYDPFVEGSGDIVEDTGDYTIEIEVGPRPGAEPVAVTLGVDEQLGGIDLAAWHLGSIVGQMYDDTNGNGIQDPGELGLDNEVLLV